MLRQILSALKVVVLALILSFGLSYALAWTQPSAQPPNANVAAPINVGATTQTKEGGDICSTISGVTKCLQSAGASIPAGTTGQTLRSDGTNWLANSNIFNNGTNVGIGTVTPQGTLSIGSPDYRLDKGDVSPNSGYLRFGDNTGWKFHIGRSRESAGGAYNAGTTGTLMTVQDNGNVGIGTTAPASGLHLSGDKYATFGPNSSWGANLQVGGNGRVTTNASVAATNGNLHLDARNGGYGTYFNWYASGTTGVHVGNGAANYGPVYANDYYSTAAGKWMSQMGGGSNFEIINAANNTAYTRSYTGKILVIYKGNAFQGGLANLAWYFYFNGANINSWSGTVNYQVMANPSYYYTTTVNGSFSVQLYVNPDQGGNQIIIYYM